MCTCSMYITGYSVFDNQIKNKNYLKDCKCLPSCTDLKYTHESIESPRNWTTASSKLKL